VAIPKVYYAFLRALHHRSAASRTASQRIFRVAYNGFEIGFGPLSPTRSDFTTCFVDATVDVVSLALVAVGAINIYFLRKQTAYPVEKNWHYWLKLVSGFTLWDM
jgi:hypothetical protein